MSPLDLLIFHIIFFPILLASHGNNKDLENAEYLDNTIIWVKTHICVNVKKKTLKSKYNHCYIKLNVYMYF